MKISTNDIIDSVKSLSSSLNRLVGIRLCEWQNSPIIFSCEEDIVNFRVVRAKTQYKMSVFADDDYEHLSRCQNRAMLLSALDCDALVGYEFHHNELAVSTIDGRCVSRSFTLEQIPQGETLKHWLEQQTHTPEEMIELAGKLIETAKIISSARICHGKIKPQNIVIQSDGRIKLTDYSRLSRLYEMNYSTDSKALLAVAVIAMLSSQGILSPEIDGSLSSFNKLKRALESAHKSGAINKELYLRIDAGLNVGDLNMIAELNQLMCSPKPKPKGAYDSVGAYHENVATAKLDGMYGYIDREGNPLTQFKYTLAEDIYEGYAIVKIGDRSGVINKLGEEIVPIEYNEVLSPAECGMFAFRRGSKWTLRTLSGKRIGGEFDSVIKYSTGIFKVSKNRLWGLVEYRGEILVPIAYDDIQPISDKECRLSHNGHSLIWRFRKE